MAGLQVGTVIWIASEFRAAHLSAIKWLNDNTIEGFSFFAVRVRAVRIGDSPLAPVFDVLEKPNAFERRLQAAAPKLRQAGRQDDLKREFWAAYLSRHPDDAALGVDGASGWLSIEGAVFVRFYVGPTMIGLAVRGGRDADPPLAIARIEPVAAELDRRLGTRFDPTRSEYLSTYKRLDLVDRACWPDAIDWLHERVRTYKAALSELLAESG